MTSPSSIPHRKSVSATAIAFLIAALQLCLLPLATATPAMAQVPSSQDWTQFLRDNMERWNPYETVLGVNNVANLGLKWSVIGAGSSYEYPSPAVVNGVLYIGSAFKVVALNAGTGAQVWSFSTGASVNSSPAVANGIVYASSEDGYVYALNANTGAQVWRYSMGANHQISSPAVANGVVYVSGNDTLFALNATSGAKLWSYATGSTAGYQFGTVVSSPAVVSGVVYIGGGDGNVYALNASTGAKIWSFSTGYLIQASPAVANGVVYIASLSGYVYALNATTGAQLWNYYVVGDVEAALAVANGLVYVASNYQGTLYALNASTGSKVWSYSVGAFNPALSSPAVANGVVYIGALNGQPGQVYALNAANGLLLWSHVTNNQVRSGLTVVNGVLYVHTGAGYEEVLAFAVGAGSADLYLRAQTSPTPVSTGTLLTYIFPVWNLGPDNASHEVLTTHVPAGTTFDYVRVSGTPGLATCSHPPYGGTGTVVCNENGTMAPNTTWTVRLTVKVTASSGTILTESATATEDTV